MSTAVDQARERISNTIGGPVPLQFPPGWTLSTSWARAQDDEATVGPSGPARFDVLLGDGDRHRTTFAIHGGKLMVECDCAGFRYSEFCAHVAHLWWKWARSQLAVTDLDTGKTHLSAPWWLRVNR